MNHPARVLDELKQAFVRQNQDLDTLERALAALDSAQHLDVPADALAAIDSALDVAPVPSSTPPLPQHGTRA